MKTPLAEDNSYRPVLVRTVARNVSFLERLSDQMSIRVESLVSMSSTEAPDWLTHTHSRQKQACSFDHVYKSSGLSMQWNRLYLVMLVGSTIGLRSGYLCVIYVLFSIHHIYCLCTCFILEFTMFLWRLGWSYRAFSWGCNFRMLFNNCFYISSGHLSLPAILFHTLLYRIKSLLCSY